MRNAIIQVERGAVTTRLSFALANGIQAEFTLGKDSTPKAREEFKKISFAAFFEAVGREQGLLMAASLADQVEGVAS